MTDQVYRDARGAIVELGAVLGGGGEGTVLAIRGRPALCAKIYRPETAALRADKIQTMLDRRPPWLVRRALAWPVATLHGHDGKFAGFVMPVQRGAIELFQLIVPDERMQIAGWLTERDLCAIAARLAGIVAGVHRAGHCVGDLKPQNILVKPTTGRIALIDTDSFQIHDRKRGAPLRSRVVTPEYTAPELLGRDPAAVDRTPASDAFALAVLIHQILLGGATRSRASSCPAAAAPASSGSPAGSAAACARGSRGSRASGQPRARCRSNCSPRSCGRCSSAASAPARPGPPSDPARRSGRGRCSVRARRWSAVPRVRCTHTPRGSPAARGALGGRARGSICSSPIRAGSGRSSSARPTRARPRRCACDGCVSISTGDESPAP
jgi:hypothetical protein